MTLAYADGCPALISGHRAGYKTLLITVDGGHSRVGFPAQLNLICGLLVSDFGAPAAPPPGSTSPLNVLAVTVTMPATLAAGTTVSYSVTLHNTSGRRLTLSPCPSYTQYLAVLTGNTQAVAVQQYFYLNCAARQVPARGSVTFAMCIPVPAASDRAKYDWQLQDTNVATAGVVTVRQPWPPSIRRIRIVKRRAACTTKRGRQAVAPRAGRLCVAGRWRVRRSRRRGTAGSGVSPALVFSRTGAVHCLRCSCRLADSCPRPGAATRNGPDPPVSR